MKYNQLDKRRGRERERGRRDAAGKGREKSEREQERRTFRRVDSRDDSPRLVKPSSDTDIEFMVTMETGPEARRLYALSLIPAIT